MTAQQQYDSLDSKQRRDLLLQIGETREEARALSQRDYNALSRALGFSWTPNCDENE